MNKATKAKINKRKLHNLNSLAVEVLCVSTHAIDLKAGKLDIDEKTGIIKGLSIITEGQALGHGFVIDNVFLKQLMKAGNAVAAGIKSRLTHPGGIFGADPIEKMLGRVKNFSIDGNQLRGDLHLANYAAKNPAGDLRAYILAIADEDPAAVGPSISFERSGLAERGKDPKSGENLPPAVRLENFLAVDVVGDPAANPGGMLAKNGGTPIVPTITTENKPTDNGASLMKKQLKAYLIQCGLKADATDAEALTYLAALPVENKAIADALAAAPAPAPAAPVVPAVELATVPAMPTAPVVPSTTAAADLAAANLAAITAERERGTVITALAAQHGFDSKWVKAKIEGGDDLASVREDVLAKLAKDRAPLGIGAVEVGDDLNLTTLGPGIASALAIRAGVLKHEIIEPTPGRFDFARNADGSPKTVVHHERANEFRGMTLLETGRRYFEARGIDTRGWSKNELSARLINKNALYDHVGFSHQLNQSTGDFDAILEDTIGKTLRQAYLDGQRTWTQCFARATAPDFKQISRTSLSESPDLEIIQDNGEIKYVKLSATKEVYALTDYGNIIPFTRKALINDDMNAFGKIPLLQGAAAGRKEDDVAWAIFTDNAVLQDSVDLFHATHANLGTGAISVVALGVMRALLRKQLGPNGDARLNLKSKYLIVPAALETIAENFLDSQFDPAKSNNTPNPFKGKLELVVEPRLDDTSALQYYTAADSSQMDTVEVCFLDDEPEPVFSREVDFDTEALKFKVTHTVAAKAIDFRGVARSSGA